MQDSRSSAERWNERYSDVDRLWSRKPNALLAGFVEGLEPGSAVDIGAGEGRNSVWLAQAGWRVTAVDVSDVGLARAERHAAEVGVEIECVVADWRSYRAPGAFDLAVISFMHPLSEERAGMFAHAGEMLRPGGHLFTVGVEIGELGRRGPKDPERLYTPERLREALAGFEVVRCERVAYQGETTDGSRPVVDCVAIGRLPGGEAT